MSATAKLARRQRAIPSASKARLRLWLRLLRTAREIEADLRERLRVTFDTTMPRFDVMAALAREPDGMTMTALSRQLLVSNGNVTGIVERLVQDGFVTRIADSRDKRAIFVRLTSKGTADFAAMAAAHETWVNALLSDFDTADLETLNALLQRAAQPQHLAET